jgi:hypothetical protein
MEVQIIFQHYRIVDKNKYHHINIPWVRTDKITNSW